MPKQYTLEDFITKANTVHNFKYDYAKVVYVNSHTKVTITCPDHGDFLQKPCSHTNSRQGCSVCTRNAPYTTEIFIEKANEVHGNKYDYSNVVFTRMHDKVSITCPIHGEFEQKAYVHIQGHNCPQCGKITTKNKLQERGNSWSYSGWEANGLTSEYFEAFTLYIIECWNEDESFIKIGKTFTSLHRRFVKGALPYSWKVLNQYTGSADYISKLEAELHSKYCNHKYIPKLHFNGYLECYSHNLKELYEINA